MILLLKSKFKDGKVNILRFKKYDDGNTFITLSNGINKESGFKKQCVIVINEQQLEELKQWINN